MLTGASEASTSLLAWLLGMSPRDYIMKANLGSDGCILWPFWPRKRTPSGDLLNIFQNELSVLFNFQFSRTSCYKSNKTYATFMLRYIYIAMNGKLPIHTVQLNSSVYF